MIIPDTRFDLAALGIGPLAERVYLYLIDEGEGRSADAVAGRLGMDVPPVRIALEQLERRLLITRSAAPVPHYTARPPEPALESLVSRFGDELAQIRLYARDLQGRFREVGGRSGPSDMLEVVVGRREVLRHYAHLLESAKQEVSVFTKPPTSCPAAPRTWTRCCTRRARASGAASATGPSTTARPWMCRSRWRWPGRAWNWARRPGWWTTFP